ncbi:MAG: beta-propeller domain-containing protein [Porticoccaceae bacterium]|nr:beta-propeller domain-containing protein [Porticoccaceae bacterium]
MNKSLRVCAPSLAIILLCACGGGGRSTESNNSDPISGTEPDSKGLLTAVKSDAELLETVRRGFNKTTNSILQTAAPEASEDVAASAGSNRSASSFTTTYTLEANIDEHDYVKYDGNHLFIAPSRSMDCCFIVDDIAIAAESDAIPSSSDNGRSIRIISTDPENAGATEVGNIELSDSRTVEGLYTNNSQLVAISSSGWWGAYGDSFARVANWQSQTTALNVYDISDTSAPEVQMQIEFEGGFVNSRKQGDMVYLIARHTPYLENFIYYPDEQQMAANGQLLDNLTVDDILPKMVINGTESPLIEAKDCLITNTNNDLSPDETGYPTMTLLVAVNLADQSIAKTSCYSEPTEGIYVSENAIYLTQIDYSDSGSRTLVHSYELSENLTYLGSGAAEGSLYLSGDKDFRINEHEGYLRLVTTERTGDSADWIDHKLSIFKLNADEVELELMATLPNAQRPQAIGKPNEDLYGVRFFGDKLYLVTFERIDPLYVLDLSTPTDPLISGELEVTGFSDFLHPVNDELLMGLGQDESGLVKLELFNVADMASPYSLGTVALGENEDVRWSYSEARYNRHAFTYQVVSESKDRFLVPANLDFNLENSDYQNQDRLYLFELNGKDHAASASIDEIGQIKVERNWWQSSRNRSVIHGDAVYYINDTSVWSTLWTNPIEQNGPI